MKTKKISSKFVNVFLANLIRLPNFKRVSFSPVLNRYTVTFVRPICLTKDFSKYHMITIRLDGEVVLNKFPDSWLKITDDDMEFS